jgi:hypothetical protein
MTDLASFPVQKSVRVRQAGAEQEAQGHPAREDRERQHGLRHLPGRPEADRERVVIVVDHDRRAGQPRPHLRDQAVRLRLYLRSEFRQEAVELALCVHGRLPGPS